MGDDKRLVEAAEQAELEAVEASRHAALEVLRYENANLRRDLAATIRDKERLKEDYRQAFAIDLSDQKIPDWAPEAPKGAANLGRPVLMLSDLHLDERVELRSMGGLNEYDRSIAERRLGRTVDRTVDFLHRNTAGVDFDGIVVALLGDIFTGTIHDELARTNEAPMPASIVHWTPIFVSALRYLADEFDRVWVPCIDGNHDRNGKEKPSKLRAEEAWSWVFYHGLSTALADDDRISFTISPSSELIAPVFDTTFLLVHGDQTKGGHGIGGIYPPIMRYVAKAIELYSSPAYQLSIDYVLMGHWHQLIFGQRLIVNGSLKGYDEYAAGHKFSYEEPKQALFVVTPERGITMRTEIFAENDRPRVDLTAAGTIVA